MLLLIEARNPLVVRELGNFGETLPTGSVLEKCHILFILREYKHSLVDLPC